MSYDLINEFQSILLAPRMYQHLKNEKRNELNTYTRCEKIRRKNIIDCAECRNIGMITAWKDAAIASVQRMRLKQGSVSIRIGS